MRGSSVGGTVPGDAEMFLRGPGHAGDVEEPDSDIQLDRYSNSSSSDDLEPPFARSGTDTTEATLTWIPREALSYRVPQEEAGFPSQPTSSTTRLLDHHDVSAQIHGGFLSPEHSTRVSLDMPPPVMPPSEKKTPGWAWGVLGASIVIFSGQGTVLRTFSPLVSPFSLMFWRNSYCILALLVPGYLQLQRASPLEKKLILSWKFFFQAALLSAFSLVWMAAFVIAVRLSTLATCIMFSNFHPIFIILFKIFGCKPVNRWQIAGTVVAGGGLVFSSLFTTSSSSEEHTVLGDAIALLGGLMGAFYLSSAPPFFRMAGKCKLTATFLVYLLINVMILPVWFIKPTEDPSLDSYSFVGELFSFMDPTGPYFVNCLILGLVIGIFGSVTLTWLGDLFSSLVMSLAYLQQPLLGMMIGWAFGLSSAPSLTSLSGAAILLSGVGLVLRGEILEAKMLASKLSTDGQLPSHIGASGPLDGDLGLSWAPGSIGTETRGGEVVDAEDRESFGLLACAEPSDAHHTFEMQRMETESRVPAVMFTTTTLTSAPSGTYSGSDLVERTSYLPLPQDSLVDLASVPGVESFGYSDAAMPTTLEDIPPQASGTAIGSNNLMTLETYEYIPVSEESVSDAGPGIGHSPLDVSSVPPSMAVEEPGAFILGLVAPVEGGSDEDEDAVLLPQTVTTPHSPLATGSPQL